MIAEARVALSKVNLNEVLLHSSSIERYRADLSSLAGMDRAKADEYTGDVMASVEKMYGFGSPRERTKPFAYQDGVAVIPVHGALLNRFNSCWGFVTGYNFIRAQMNAAEADPDVERIVFDVDSPGGDAAGCFELTADIRALTKPTMAVIDDTGCSGGYAIPAACNTVVATPSAQVGSIGVYRLHVDASGANAQAGLVFTFVYSGEHKVDGNPMEALSDEVRADWQAKVDQRREQFVADIAISRDLDPEVIRDTEARVYNADEALALGLLDAVKTPTQAVSSFLAESGDDVPVENEDDEMALPKNDTELAEMIENAKREGAASVNVSEAAANAVKADRERRTAITALDEAKDRPKLAATLADTDGMTAETAKAILASAAVEKAEQKGSGLREAMDQAGGAGVQTDEQPGGGGNGGEPDKDKAASAGILKFVAPARRVGEGK